MFGSSDWWRTLVRTRDAAGCHQAKAVRPDRARELLGHLQSSYGVSERRACNAFPTSRATIRYQSRRPDQASLQMRIKDARGNQSEIRISQYPCLVAA